MIDAITIDALVEEILKTCRLEEFVAKSTLKNCIDISPTIPFDHIAEHTEKKRLAAILFCNPNTDFCKREITKQLNYFHFRSEKSINIFCCGFGADWETNKFSDQKLVTEIDGKKWSYSDQAFISLVNKFEEKTKWKYSGENELILLDIVPDLKNENVGFISAIVCNLERMHKDLAFSSVRSFIEDIIRYARNHISPNISSFSDVQGLKVASGSLKEVILSFLPEKLRGFYKKAESLAVRNITD